MKNNSASQTILKSICQLALAFGLLATSAVAASEPLHPFSATYNVIYENMEAEVNLSLKAMKNGNYQFEISADHFLGNYQALSEFTISEQDHLKPINYAKYQKFFGVVKQEETIFDWQTNKAFYVSKKKKRQAELENGSLDRINYQLQLAKDIKNGKEKLSYQVIKRGKVKYYNFEVIGHETISTPAGEFATIQVKQLYDKPDRETTMWMIPSKDYLVAKYHQIDKGDVYIGLLTHVEQKISHRELSTKTAAATK